MELQYRDGAPPEWAIEAHCGKWLCVFLDGGRIFPDVVQSKTQFRKIPTRIMKSAPLSDDGMPAPYPTHPDAPVWDAAIEAAARVVSDLVGPGVTGRVLALKGGPK